MPTICFCNTNIAWGGGEKWHLEAALSLAARGWRVFMLCHTKSALYAKVKDLTNVTAIPVRSDRLSFINPLKQAKLTRFFRQHQVDAVLLNLPADVKSMGRAAKSAGVPHIIYRRGSDLPVKDTAFNRYLFRHVITRLIVNSEATRAAIFTHNPDLLPASRVTVLGNGIDVAAFDAAQAAAKPLPFFTGGIEQPSTRSAYSGIVIGNAGRLNKQKAQQYLVHLAVSLQAMHLPFTIIIAGTGEREQELKELAASLNVSSHIIFTGFLDDLAPFWKSIDIFVLSSLWEGFGFVILEAMLAKKPVLAFQVSNIPELVRPDENGLLFPLPAQATDMKAMASAIACLVAEPERQKNMGVAGRSFAESHFSQHVCMDKLEALLSVPGKGTSQ